MRSERLSDQTYYIWVDVSQERLQEVAGVIAVVPMAGNLYLVTLSKLSEASEVIANIEQLERGETS